MSTPADLEALTKRFQTAFGAGFTGAMNMELLSASPERVVLELVVGPEHLQPQGLVNGGVLCGMVESAGSIGGALNAKDGQVVVGVENHTSFLRPTREGRLVATARPVHLGRRSQLWETTIENDQGKQVARGSLRLMAVDATG
jgi:uncharacterized protein (TIGR00369 family)